MSNVETLGALGRRLNVFVPQQQFRSEVEARLKNLGRTAKVHGFRPGKVPIKILEQQYGSQIHREVLEEALRRAFVEAVQANSLKVAGSPEFVSKTHDPDAAQIEYVATFEVYPEVVLGDIAKTSVERVTYSLSDADIESTIATLRKQRVIFEPCQRAAGSDDQVHIDFSGMLDGAVFEGGEARGFAFVLGLGRMLPDFEKAIIGMQAGQIKSFDMTFPDDYHGKNVAGKKVTFTITLHTVEAPRLPDLDADFAKLLGIQDGDVDTLRAEIRRNLTRDIDRRLKVRNKDSAMDALLKITPLDVPKALLDAEAQNVMQQTLREMTERGMKIPQGMSLSPALFAERAQRRVKLGLIVSELVKLQDLSAKPAQVKALLAEYAQGYDKPEEVIKWHYEDPSRMQTVESLALEDNVVAWVMDNAKVTDKKIGFNELMGND